MFYIRNWIESGIVSVGHLLGPNGYLSYEHFKAKYPDAIVNFMLYESIVRSVRHYQARLGLEFEENCNINEADFWMSCWLMSFAGGVISLLSLLNNLPVSLLCCLI